MDTVRFDHERGVTLLESVFVLAALMVGAGMALGIALDWQAQSRGIGAARLVLGQVRLARALAVREGRSVGLVFATASDGDLTFRLHRDGNGNGVRRVDAERGIDPPVGAIIRLRDWFAGTRFAIPIPLPPMDEDGEALTIGADPIRLAAGSRVLSCSPEGTATSGSVLVSGPRLDVFAIRLLGVSGRLRLLLYSPARAAWEERW